MSWQTDSEFFEAISVARFFESPRIMLCKSQTQIINFNGGRTQSDTQRRLRCRLPPFWEAHHAWNKQQEITRQVIKRLFSNRNQNQVCFFTKVDSILVAISATHKWILHNGNWKFIRNSVQQLQCIHFQDLEFEFPAKENSYTCNWFLGKFLIFL